MEIFSGLLARAALGVFAILALTASGAELIEAENALENPEVLVKDRLGKGHWTLWSTDTDAAKKWSGGVVIRGEGVKEDRTPGEGTPILNFSLPLPAKGKFDIYAKVQRTVALSTDGGKTWKRFTGHGFIAREVDGANGPYKFRIADAMVNPDGPGACYIDSFEIRPNQRSAQLAGRQIEVANGDFEQVADGKFERWAAFWARNPKAGSRVEPSSLNPRSGKYAARFVIRDGADWAWSNNRFPVEPGEEFTVSCYARKLNDKMADSAVQFIGSKDGKLVSYDTGSLWLGGMTQEWQKYEKTFVVPYNVDSLQARMMGVGIADFEIDDLEIKLIGKKPVVVPNLPKPREKYEPVTGFAKTRVEEKFDRALIAAPVESGVYLSWRLLKDDAPDIAFDVFRVTGGKEAKVNAAPVRQTTDFTDLTPGKASMYIVRPAAGFKGLAGEAAVREKAVGNPHLTFKLSNPKGRVDKVGIGDLDGDGKYDIVGRIASSNIDPWHVYWSRSPDTYQLEGFTQDGKRLWTVDLGWSIERGIWYSPFIVYDFNGDGKAEVAVKMGEGDPRDPDGRVTKGKEYLAVLDGMTGKIIDQVPWPDRDGFSGPDGGYNLFSRNQLAVAYLDGKTPAVIALRGTYTTMKADAWQLKDGKLESLWKYDSRAYGREWQGQGAHTTRVADVDGDGRDEVILGSAVLDDDGRPLWTTGLGHPDYIYVTNATNKNPGMEIVTILETATRHGGGLHVADAKTGKTVWKLAEPANHIHHGFGADLDPRYRGLEIGGIDTDSSLDRTKLGRWFFNGDGEMLYRDDKMPVNEAVRTLFWDADLQREIVSAMPYDFLGGPAGGITEGFFITAADILGDWREEMITSVKGEVRIYSTTIPAMDRRVCLMQDPQYRLAAAASSMGYMYDSCLSYLPTDLSPNLNLTLSADGLKRSLRVVVSAPLEKPLKGTLKLLPPPCLELTPIEQAVDLPKGGLAALEIGTKVVGVLKGDVRAELTLDDGTVLRGQVAVKVSPLKLNIPKPQGFIAEAEDFIAEKGGKAKVRSDKVGVNKDKAISHWDAAGHELAWKIDLPKAGKYILQMRYAMGPATRTIWINDEKLGDFVIPGSGGMGEGGADWELYSADRNGGTLVLELKAGPQTIRINNTKGDSLNLDYISLVPVKD